LDALGASILPAALPPPPLSCAQQGDADEQILADAATQTDHAPDATRIAQKSFALQSVPQTPPPRTSGTTRHAEKGTAGAGRNATDPHRAKDAIMTANGGGGLGLAAKRPEDIGTANTPRRPEINWEQYDPNWKALAYDSPVLAKLTQHVQRRYAEIAGHPVQRLIYLYDAIESAGASQPSNAQKQILQNPSPPQLCSAAIGYERLWSAFLLEDDIAEEEKAKSVKRASDILEELALLL
jgi:hypothetical protein